MNKRHILSFLSVAFTFVIFFTGCKSFDPNERGPLDQKTDEENFAHIKEIIHSDNSILKKKVKIRIAPMKYKYYHERNRRVSPEQNKELLGIINSQLISMFQSIKDFEIVNPDTNKNHSDEGKKSKSNVWTVTYSINKIEFADNCHIMRTLISDTPEEYEENLKRYKENISKRYSVIFSLELHLISPNGDKYFTFKNTVESKGRSNSPDFQFIKAELGKTFPYVSGRLYRKLLPPVYRNDFTSKASGN